MDDDSRLRERIETMCTALGMIVGQLTGPPGFTTDAVGMAVRLKLNHDELMLIRTSVQRIGIGIFAIAIATVASVWHHW